MTDDEQLFRAVAAGVMVLGGAVGGYHRIRAARVGEPINHTAEPRAIRFSLKLCGAVGMAFLLLWLVRPTTVGWAAVPLPGWVRWAGAAIALAGVPLLAW